MMTGKQLKNAILQLAIQGKLVPQDANDEPASVLLAQIRKEKEQLLKAGKLKKKDLETTPITDEEKPFEIPESWEWVRLGEALDVRDGTHDSPKYFSEGYPLITSKNLKNGIIDFSTALLINENDYIKINERSRVDDGDILYAMIGSIGNPAIVKKDRDFAIKNMALFKNVKNAVFMPYVFYFLELAQYSMREYASGGVQSFVSLGYLRNYIIPLPPLTEQMRIVAKIEELMPLVEEYGVAQEKLNRLNEALPEALKKSILQQAILGKLVPQDANDEPASALLVQIRKEKEQLLKAGKLKKKDLATTPIADEEKPFDIPESWKWVRLVDCVSNRAGLAYNKGDLDKKTSDMIRVLRGGNIFYGGWKKEDNDVMIAREFVNDDLLLKKGTFITPAVTSLENMGKTALIDEDLYDTVVGGFVLMLQSFLYENSLLKYLLYFFCSAYYKEYCKSITNKSGQAFYNISRAKLMNLPIPLPPLPEQKRIVAKIEELMAMVDGMK